jgi:alpha-galactosidase
MRLLLISSVFCLLGCHVLRADPAPATPTPSPITIDAFRSAHPPFTFIYGGRNSTDFISTWQKNEQTTPGEGGETHRFTFIDPATKLEVDVDVRTFTSYPALYWVLQFTNKGGQDTPIIEQVLPLDWPDAVQGTGSDIILHGARGSAGGHDDYAPIERPINGGDGLRGSQGSSDEMPFFNLQHQDEGLIGAIGWWGRWQIDFQPNKSSTAASVRGGMPDIHLLLHPGETIRLPSILLLPWKGGDYLDAQNRWRHLALDYFSPRDTKGRRIDVPLTIGGWGEEPIDKKIALINAVHKAQIPMEVYWVDAGWYGDPTKNWVDNIGTWKPAVKDYPNGIRPLGDALHHLGYKFLLWMAAGEATPNSDIVKQHPDWFIANDDHMMRAKFNDPAVCQGMTDIITGILKDAGADWFRQDGGSSPEGAGDAPDRAGMGQIQYVNNYLTFWDGLRANISGLQIDNCYGGGKRLDIETIQRSVSLWRSDSMVGAYDPSMEQCQAQGMIEWIPMSGGVYIIDGSAAPGSAKQLYEARSTYCAGWDFGLGKVEGWMRAQALEYKEVQPYFYGDFYPLIRYTESLDDWMVWQLDRPDLKSGCVILLRRPQSPFATIDLPLRKIDPAVTYEVEVRSGIVHATPRTMSGADLAKLPVTIVDEPGSALVFYRKL